MHELSSQNCITASASILCSLIDNVVGYLIKTKYHKPLLVDKFPEEI